MRTDPWDFRGRCPPDPRARRYVLKADTSRQWRLLDLQAIDTRLDQIAHRTATLPEQRQLDEVAAASSPCSTTTSCGARTAAGDVQREVAKADSDVQLVRDRAARNQTRLDAGQGTAKDMQALQHELDSLARRQAELEDIELEVMERAEGLAAARGRARGAAGRARDPHRRADGRPRPGADRAGRRGRRRWPGRAATSSPGSATSCVALYEKIRASSGGIGAAALRQRRCEGCRLELNQVDINRIRAAADDEVLRCEECRRILVRTAESGL